MSKSLYLILCVILLLVSNPVCYGTDGDAAGVEEPTERISPEGHEEAIIRLNEKSFERLGIAIEKVGVRRLPAFIETTAEIEFNSNRLIHIKPRVQGRVVQIFADFGQEVRDGERLALLDSAELARAIAQYHTKKIKAEVAQANYEREKKLWEKKVSSEKEMLDAKGKYLSLKADLEEAHERLRLLGLSSEEIASLPDKEHDTSTFPILSPFGGTVVDKRITLGDVVEPTDTLFTIANLDVMWIIADIYEKDLSKIKLHQDAEILVNAYPREVFHGEITYISSMVDEKTRTVKVRIEIDNRARKLKAGMFADVRIYTGRPGGAQRYLFVPTIAVQRYAGETIVFVAKGDYLFEVRPVETGGEQEGLTMVLRGLKEGEGIVTKGSFYLKSEMLKETLEAEE